jgi:hypothetical protein
MDWKDNIEIYLRGKGRTRDGWSWFRIYPMADLGVRAFDFGYQNVGKLVKLVTFHFRTILLDQTEDREIFK